MLLLDTHAIIWIGEGEPIERKARRAVEAARSEGGVLVSPISAWEIGLLVTKGRILTFGTHAGRLAGALSRSARRKGGPAHDASSTRLHASCPNRSLATRPTAC